MLRIPASDRKTLPNFVSNEIFNCISIMLLIYLLLNYDGNLTRTEIMWISGAILQTISATLLHIAYIYHSFHGVSYRMNSAGKSRF